MQRCSDLRSARPRPPSPYLVYRFFDFPDCPTPTVEDSCHPNFDHLRTYSVPMDLHLHRYLGTAHLCLYVFDFKEEQMDRYVGKAAVPLSPLVHKQKVTGEKGPEEQKQTNRSRRLNVSLVSRCV